MTDWQPIETAPKDGTRFIGTRNGHVDMCMWCKTPHIPIYGFHFTSGDPEAWELTNIDAWQPLPKPPHRTDE